MNRPDDANARGNGQERRPPYLEIHLGRSRRLWGLVAYLALFAATCAALVWFLRWFNTPLPLAVGLVVFMVGYMVLMAWWAGRSARRRESDTIDLG